MLGPCFLRSRCRLVGGQQAAGDQGVWGREGPGLKYHPDFPAASPYVTAVGGTDFETSAIGNETAWKASGAD